MMVTCYAGGHENSQPLNFSVTCLADRAYTGFSFLNDLRARGVFFVIV
ncbi:MAG TPA: hypothetical protein P5026_06235 [Kiritimatiellia bacterium]|nr:hypothetical protein [Kiritimatiellia bacterium]HRU70645.1 hypothetical protein [Kiritimatiellia bacterium]